MLRRSNEGKDKPDKSIEKKPENTMSREEFIMHNEDARRVYEDIMKLRQSVANLKQPGSEQPAQTV